MSSSGCVFINSGYIHTLTTKLVWYLMKTPASPVCWLASPTCGKTECNWFCFHVSEQLRQKHKAEHWSLKIKADVELKVRRLAFKCLLSPLAHFSPLGFQLIQPVTWCDTQMLKKRPSQWTIHEDLLTRPQGGGDPTVESGECRVQAFTLS